MGQLIKLQDYVSRYEQNIFLYPSRYVRLKKQQWEKILSIWERGESLERYEEDLSLTIWNEEEKEPFMDKVKGFFHIGKGEDSEEPFPERFEQEQNGEASFLFSPSFKNKPSTVEELKQQFLNQLLPFQIKWASATLTEKSFVDKRFYTDNRLKYFLQRFPDTFLVLYRPIFLVKKAPVEVETILITPTDVWCISFLEQEDSAVYSGSGERFWTKRVGKREERVLNPLLALNRTEKIVKSIFQLHAIDLPIHKVILSRNGYFDYPFAPFDVELIEKRNYDNWFHTMRMYRSPLKHMQFKAAKGLLEFCQTSSIPRLEWETHEE